MVQAIISLEQIARAITPSNDFTLKNVSVIDVNEDKDIALYIREGGQLSGWISVNELLQVIRKLKALEIHGASKSLGQ